MKLTDLFGCTFVINLPERRDRRRAITRELERAGTPFSRGKVELFSAVKPKVAAGFPSRGVRGCFLSHLSVLRLARERDCESVLILEDDLTLSPLLGPNVDVLADVLQRKTWGFVYLGHVEPLDEAEGANLLPFTGPLRTSHFYAVSRPAIDALCQYLEAAHDRAPGDPAGGPMHLDAALTMFRAEHPELTTYIANPNLGWQRSSRSDIHSTFSQSAPVLRNFYDVARYLRGRLLRRT
jgi:hypothetical protein